MLVLVLGYYTRLSFHLLSASVFIFCLTFPTWLLHISFFKDVRSRHDLGAVLPSWAISPMPMALITISSDSQIYVSNPDISSGPRLLYLIAYVTVSLRCVV